MLHFREVAQAAEARAMDTGKPSGAALALAWCSALAGEACHWPIGTLSACSSCLAPPGYL